MISMLFIVIIPLCGCFVTEVMRREDGGVAVSGNLATAALATFLALKHLFQAVKHLILRKRSWSGSPDANVGFLILQTRPDKSFRSPKLL